MLFWLYFFCFNTIIFLPVYLIHFPQSSFFPKRNWQHKKGKARFDFLFCKLNQDIFKVSVDLAIISLIGIFLNNIILIAIFSIACGIYFVLIVVYQVINALCRKIYHKELTNFEIIQYLSLGYTIVRHSALHQIIGTLISIALLIFSSCYLFFNYFSWINNHPISPVTMVILGLVTIIPYYVKNNVVTLVFTNKVFPLHFYEMYRMLFKTSFKGYQLTKKIDIDKILTLSPKTNYTLRRTPNVFVIVIESYGRINIDEIDNPLNNYHQSIAAAEYSLKQKGYSMASALAKCPIAGAGSWIAYTSFLFGINMQNQMIFNHFFASKKMHEYDHLFRFLQKNGYYNYRANAVGVAYDGVAVPWDEYTKYYAVDKWLHFKDMNYKGQMYGLGPAPSDQFILHNSLKLIKKENKQPFSYFLLTQNSHNPFYTFPEFNNDWKESNTPPEKLETKGAKLVSLPKLSNYFKAIEYEIKTVTNFIAQEGEGDDIFIVFGDHQPPIFNEAKKGNETPVHIITRNESFLKEWKSHGFTEGLLTSTSGQILNFEGIYSIFLRAFLSTYSNETSLPPYEPNGKSILND
jgi:hypothetical protein